VEVFTLIRGPPGTSIRDNASVKDTRRVPSLTPTGAPAAECVMTQIPIKRAVERVPGGMMVVPLACGAFFATFAPETPTFFGSFTGALFTGALPRSSAASCRWPSVC
jgi:hypothetical protein